MINPGVFNVVLFFAACLPNLIARWAYIRGFCPPWFTRNMSRFTVVAWTMSAIVDATAGLRVHTVLDVIIVALGLIGWNWPKDDEPPKRRRKRARTIEAARVGFDWTGAQTNAIACGTTGTPAIANCNCRVNIPLRKVGIGTVDGFKGGFNGGAAVSRATNCAIGPAS